MDENSPLPPLNKTPETGEPERYIRTFEKDMDVFKKGGTPGLAPYKSKTPEAVPEQKTIAPTPHFTLDALHSPAAGPLSVPVSVPISVLPPDVEDVPSPTPPVREPKPDLSETPPIQTYAQDFRQQVEKTNASTATILATEGDAAPQFSQQIATIPEKSDTRTRWYVGGGVVLLFLAGIGGYVSYAYYQKLHAPVAVAPLVQTPIFVDSREQVSGKGDALVSAIQEALAAPIEENSVKWLTFDTSMATTTDVFSSMSASIPNIIVRNIKPVGSMAGIVNTANGQSAFFILSVESYGATFSGMLSWEPKMQDTLNPLYPLYPAPLPPAPIATSTATTTQPVTREAAPLLSGSFVDETLGNHNVRVYRDSLGRSVLLYGYWDQSTLVIARDPDAFMEILNRLGTSHS